MRTSLVIAAAIALCAAGAWAQPLWTWSLYEDPGSVALANEVPDTAQLSAVLECKAGSGLAKVSVFPKGDGMNAVSAVYRTMDPAFAEFVKSGRLSFRNDAGAGEIEMKPEHRPKLERFARLCGT